MEQKVLIPSDISQPGKDYLRERGYVIKMGRGIDEQTIMEDDDLPAYDFENVPAYKSNHLFDHQQIQ